MELQKLETMWLERKTSGFTEEGYVLLTEDNINIIAGTIETLIKNQNKIIDIINLRNT